MSTENVASITRTKMLDEAVKRGWTFDFIGERQFFYRITNKKGQSCIFHGSNPQTTSWAGHYISLHKLQSLEYLKSKNIAIAPYMLFADMQEAMAFMQQHMPIVVKPEDSEKSKGVTVNITTAAQLKKAIVDAQQHSKNVLLQKQLNGQLYRVVTIGEKFFAASCRRAAFVTGDGKHTIAQLIEAKNAHPWRGTKDTSILKVIDLDHVAEYLEGNDRLREVPAKGEEVKLSAIDSVSAGGEATDVTNSVHQSYRDALEAIVQDLGLVSCGFDLMTEDISQPMPAELPFLEMNSMPGFKIHYYPSAGGEPRDIAATLLDVTLGTA